MRSLELLALVLSGLGVYWFFLADRLLQHRDPASSWHSWLTIHTRLMQPRRTTDHSVIVDLVRRMNLTALMFLVCAILFVVVALRGLVA